MSFKIAVSGKGGTGKTTISALIISLLLKKNLTPILAVDADPNANLAETLGVEFENTVGKVLDDFLEKKESLPPGITKESLIDNKIMEILVEEKGFDLLVMGQGEGPGCYCYPNVVIRNYIDKLSSNYKYVVIDNEAGMEHISRKTNGDLDVLLLISDPTLRGIKTCGKLQNLVQKMKIKVNKFYLIINRLPVDAQSTESLLQQEVKRQNLNLLGIIPEDENIRNIDSQGIPLISLDEKVPSLKKIGELVEKIIFDKVIC